MTSEDFSKLYITEETDILTPVINDIGFTLIKEYNKNSIYYKDKNKMFIKLGLFNNNEFFYSVNTVKPRKISREEKITFGQKEGDIEYPIVDTSKYKNKITSFFYNPNKKNKEHIIFDEGKRKIIYKFRNKKYKEFTLNEFIDILIKNHLSDRLKLKRKINLLVDKLLKFIFWLADDKYDQFETFLFKYEILKEERFYEARDEKVDPFLKYFAIYKNILFIVTFILIVLIMLYSFLNISWFKNKNLGDFSVSNPIIMLFIFIFLFICNDLFKFLKNKLNDFYNKESIPKNKNFIRDLDNYLRKNSFKLKLK